MCKCFSSLLDFDYVTQYLAAFIVSVGFIVKGMHYGWSSTEVSKLLNNNSQEIDEEKLYYVSVMFTYGAVAYDLFSLANYPQLSQKIQIVLALLIMSLSWIFIAVSKSVAMFMIARFFAGAGQEIIYQTSLNYICEISDPQIRGFLGSLILIMNNFGILLIQSITPFLNIFHYSLIGITISLTELITIKWLPESPYTLLLEGKTRKARTVLRSLRSLWNVEEELDTISNVVAKQEEENYSFWSVFTVTSNRKALLIVFVLNVLQGLCGIDVSVHQIQKLSAWKLESYRIVVVTSMVSVLSCVLTAAFIDHIGRKTVLIISFSVSGLCLTILSFFIYLYKNLKIKFQAIHTGSLSCVLLYMMVYRMGIGLVPLLLSGELFPINAKNTATTITDLLAIGINIGTIWMLDKIKYFFGLYMMYLICGLNCFIGVLYTYVFIPETSNLTLDEIQNNLKQNNKTYINH